MSSAASSSATPSSSARVSPINDEDVVEAPTQRSKHVTFNDHGLMVDAAPQSQPSSLHVTASVANLQNEISHASCRETQSTKITLAFDNIRSVVMVPEKSGSKTMVPKTILDGVSGIVRPGQIMACMGSSGAGKTSLLDILSMRRPFTSGRILVNGNEITKHDLFKISAYVSQLDSLMPTLTVRETLLFHARLRLPVSVSEEAKRARVEEVIQLMGLEACVDTLVGNHLIRGVSGGERRRVSIGVELLTEPSLIFLDEPTSGLDAHTAEKIMLVLRNLAAGGRTIICTIHQPRSSIFELFSELLLLARGKTVYQGPASQAINYYDALGFPLPPKLDQADHLLDLLTFYKFDESERDAKCKEVQQAYESSPLAQQVAADIAAQEPSDIPELKLASTRPGFWRQLGYLLWRAFIDQRRNPGLLRTRVIQSMVLSCILGLIFLRLDHGQSASRSRNGLVIVLLMTTMMPVINGVVQIFPLEKAIFLREHASRVYSVLPYYISRLLSDLPSQLAGSLLYGTIVYWMTNLNSQAGNYFILMAAVLINTAASQAFGLAISALAPNVEAAMVVSPLLGMLFVLFAGFFVVIDQIPVFLRWIAYISYPKWGYQIAVVNEFAGVPFTCEAGVATCNLTNGDQILSSLGLAGASIWQAFIYMSIIMVFWQVLGFLALKLSSRNKTA